jgi:hypothetical protein
MKLKQGASLEGVNWRMFSAAVIVDSVYMLYGAEAVITSGTDSQHSMDSEHYRGNALDFRTSNLNGRTTQVAARLRAVLPGYAVIVETDHIHIQYGYDNVIGGENYRGSTDVG